MIYDYKYHFRRYESIEKDFLEIIDFIELESDFNSPNYKVGSSKLMDFCLKVGTEIETLFKIILFSEKFVDIRKNDDHKSIDKYRPIIENKYNLSDYELVVVPIKKKIMPFKDFDNRTPDWFKIYSGSKHDKLKLINEWNLKHSLFALGSLLLLIINHPSLDGQIIWLEDVKTQIFDLYGSRSRFVSDTVLGERNVIGIGDRALYIDGKAPSVPLNKRPKLYKN